MHHYACSTEESFLQYFSSDSEALASESQEKYWRNVSSVMVAVDTEQMTAWAQ